MKKRLNVINLFVPDVECGCIEDFFGSMPIFSAHTRELLLSELENRKPGPARAAD